MKIRIPDEQHAKIAANQRVMCEQIARKIEAGEPLEGFEAKIAAAVLRGHASQIPDTQKKGRGNPELSVNAIDPANVAILLAAGMRAPPRGGKRNTRAAVIARLAEHMGVDVATIRKIIRTHPQEVAEAEAFVSQG